MSAPLTASVPHRLGKAEALRRLKDGLSQAHGHFGPIASIEQETWTGDAVELHLRALGQSIVSRIEVMDDRLNIEVTLPWLLSKVAERLLPSIRKETAFLIEKK